MVALAVGRTHRAVRFARAVSPAGGGHGGHRGHPGRGHGVLRRTAVGQLSDGGAAGRGRVPVRGGRPADRHPRPGPGGDGRPGLARGPAGPRPQCEPAAAGVLAGRPLGARRRSAGPPHLAAPARRAGAALAARPHRGRPRRQRRRRPRREGRRGTAAARHRRPRAAPPAGTVGQSARRRHRVRPPHPGLTGPVGRQDRTCRPAPRRP
ncbi:hypothetical protein SGPA1_21219 [Streptomyces misionensis JCM 4497]